MAKIESGTKLKKAVKAAKKVAKVLADAAPKKKRVSKKAAVEVEAAPETEKPTVAVVAKKAKKATTPKTRKKAINSESPAQPPAELIQPELVVAEAPLPEFASPETVRPLGKIIIKPVDPSQRKPVPPPSTLAEAPSQSSEPIVLAPPAPEEPQLPYSVMPLTSRLVIGFKGLEPSLALEKLLRQYPVAGVMLFSENFESPAQLADTINLVQEMLEHHHPGHPVFVAVDYEGGRVQRFQRGFTPWPAPLKTGHANQPGLVHDVAEYMARELKTVGVNWNFAPVADINFSGKEDGIIGDRAFGKSEDRVSNLVPAFVRGLQREGVMGCAKHFPGHGGTTVDSHFQLPTLRKTLSELQRTEFKPFIRAIEEDVASVMLGHLVVPDVDDCPASLSAKWVEILRDRLGFRNLICTDDLEMKAITNDRSILDATVQALKAGVDLVLLRSEKLVTELLPALAAQRWEDFEGHELSLRRIYRLRQKYLVPYKPVYVPDLTGKLGQDKSLGLAKAAVDGSGRSYQSWKSTQHVVEKPRPEPEIQLTAHEEVQRGNGKSGGRHQQQRHHQRPGQGGPRRPHQGGGHSNKHRQRPKSW